MKISKRNISVISLLAVIAIAAGVYTLHYYRRHQMLKVEVKPFKTGNGWGYDITVDNKTYIHQQSIPAVEGNQPFVSENDAVKTGNLVIKKMIAGNLLPALSAAEVMALGVHVHATSPAVPDNK